MKKLLLFFLLTNFFVTNAQCPAPTNFTSIPAQIEGLLWTWTETGTATSWEFGVTSNYEIGSPSPSQTILLTTPGLVFVNQNSECDVYYVRSVCSNDDVSQWTIVGSPTCSQNILDYISLLSTANFYANSKRELLLYPNPAKNTLSINSDSHIEKIVISDITGKVISTQTSNCTEVDVQKLSKGIYLIEVLSTEEKVTKKFIKE